MLVQFVFAVVMIVFHSLDDFFFDGRNNIEQFQGCRFFVTHRTQDFFNPDVVFTSCINEQVGIPDQLDILWSRFISMAFHAGFEQHGNFSLVTGQLPCEIVLRKNRGNNFQFMRDGFVFLSTRLAGNQTRKRQYRHDQNRKKTFHLFKTFQDSQTQAKTGRCLSWPVNNVL